MNRIPAAAILLLLTTTCNVQGQSNASDLLVGNASVATLINKSSEGIRRHPDDLNARLVQMESFRLALDERHELAAALALLESTATTDDPRGQLAAERVLELAANTAAFHSAVPRIARLLRSRGPYSRLLSDALLTAKADGVRVPATIPLTQPITHWQIAGPFGKYSNVDFERAWPAELDQLRSPQLGDRHREDIEVQNGRLDLPDYFSRSAVYYAAADFRSGRRGQYRLTIESEGTFQLCLNKRAVLTHDARFRQLPSTVHLKLDLVPGQHRFVLKLHPSALPIRVWIEEPFQQRPPTARISTVVLAYTQRAMSLAEGAVRVDSSIDVRPNKLFDFLRAEELLRDGQEEPANELFTAIADSDRHVLRAHLELAQLAFGEDHFEDAASHLRPVLAQISPDWHAQELRYQLASHFAWQDEQEQALVRRLALHPNCSAWQDANKLYSAQEKFAQASNAVEHLATCSDTPYIYWTQLSERGEHTRALSHIDGYLRHHQLDRRALNAAIREAVLAGRDTHARQYAAVMAKIAPNFTLGKQLVSAPESILDSRSAAVRSKPSDFWTPYNRDPVAQMANQIDENADARLLINDKVIDLRPEGDAWIYRHTVVQVFDKQGMENEGEIAIPRPAELLTLQTVKKNGTRVQPELTDAKSTVSMPSLEPGDAVETAYLQHFSAETIENSPHNLDFAYTAPDSPTESAQLTLIRNHGRQPVFINSIAARLRRETTDGNKHITSWEISNQPAHTQEPAAPDFDAGPTFRFLATNRIQQANETARLRDKLITATRITPAVQRAASDIHQADPGKRIAAAYEKVASSVANNDESWQSGSVSSADESFENGEGNRAAALIALLSAMGFEADLQLGAERGSYNAAERCELQGCFRYPLVRVTLPDHSHRLLDPQTDGAAAGTLAPQIEGQPSIVISRTHAVAAQLATVPVTTDQKSVATADLELDSDCKIHGSLHIRFGSFRGAQVRMALRSMSAHDRQMYFEQIASRILPNPHGVSALVFNQEDISQPLQLDLKVSSASVGHFNGTEIEIGQIIPALGLSRLYASLPERRQDLLLETPLIESSEFLVHLPPGIEPLRMPESANLHTEFGDYRTQFQLQKPNVLRIIRNFRIPVQIVSPAKYPDFARFALQIDSAERQLITIQQSPVVTAETAH